MEFADFRRGYKSLIQQIDNVLKQTFEVVFQAEGPGEWKRDTELIPEISAADEQLAQITDFMKSELKIPETQEELCIKIVDQLVPFLEAELKAQTQFPFLTIVDSQVSGSTSEGLKVCRADEFDVLVHADIVDGNQLPVLTTMTSKSDPSIPPGWVRYDVVHGEGAAILPDEIMSANKDMLGTCQAKRSLRPLALLENVFRPLLECALQKYNSFTSKLREETLPELKIKLVTQGPALTLVLELPSGGFRNYPLQFKELSIDMVLALPMYEDNPPNMAIQTLPTNFVVAKTYEDKILGRKDDLLWRESFSFWEKGFLEKVKEKMGEGNCVTQVLKVAKGIREKNPSSDFKQYFCSYFLKTCLFHLCLQIPHPRAWTMSHLPHRLTDFFVLLIKFLKDKNLPHFFVSNPDLVEYFPTEKFYKGTKKVNLLGNLQPHETANIQSDIYYSVAIQKWDWLVRGLF